MKVVVVSSEVNPYAKTGGLADVSGVLPKALLKLGVDARVIMPFYSQVTKAGYRPERILSGVKCLPGPGFPRFDLYRHEQDGLKTYFISNDGYFGREELYGTPKGDYPDNALRFGFFCQAALGALRALDWKCDVIHCNDWQSALIPLYTKHLMKQDDFFNNMGVLYTIHNLAYQGLFHRNMIKPLGIPRKFYNRHGLEFHGKLNFMKSGILYSDAVNTVSKGYAREILTKEFGCGLEGLLREREASLMGITNGVDYSEWDPSTDGLIAMSYDSRHLENKSYCKKDLLSSIGFTQDTSKPVIGIVTRLAWQKGIDLIAEIMGELMLAGAIVVVLGKGDEAYEKELVRLSAKYPKSLSVNLKFDNTLAHKIEAGSDIFLMPSRYEPCGLNQMYSLRYGTIPVVRATGGLDDVITDIDKDPARGNGFKFGDASAAELLTAVKRALKYYERKNRWDEMAARCMAEDHSWLIQAGKYLEVYNGISRNT